METAWTCCCLFAHSIRGFKKIIESWDDGCHKLELLWVWLIQTRTIGLAAEIQCLAAQTQLLWHPCRFQRNTKQWNTTTAQKKINRVVGYKQLQVLSVLGKLIHRDQFMLISWIQSPRYTTVGITCRKTPMLWRAIAGLSYFYSV